MANHSFLDRLPAVAAAWALLAGVVAAEPGSLSATPLLQPYIARHALAGAVALVADKDKVLSIETFGYADVAAKKPMQEDSLFWIASQSKAMTATALLMLVDEGKVSLDDPLEKHLPEFRGQMVVTEKDDAHVLLKKPSHAPTIREALSHMSGLPFKSAIEEPTLDGLPLAAAVRSHAITPLQWEPGSRYQYSNAGINSAARVVEVVSGMPYEEFMQQRLFDPLGMKDTTFWPNKEQLARLAKSYKPDNAQTDLAETPLGQLSSPLTDHNRRFPMPAGGLFSTAQDVSRFCQMLLRGGELDGQRYLSESSFREMTKRETPASVNDSYGLGLAVGGDWFGHGGAYSTNMEVRPGKGLALVWMVQHAGFPQDGEKAQGDFRQWAIQNFGEGQ